MAEMKPSEVMQAFLDYLKTCQVEYQESASEVWKHDKRVQDILHELEFAANKQERNKVATKASNSRKARRKAKDRAQLLENCAKFYGDKANKPFIEKLKSLIAEQKKVEEYLESERIYKPRVGDEE